MTLSSVLGILCVGYIMVLQTTAAAPTADNGLNNIWYMAYFELLAFSGQLDSPTQYETAL